MLLEVVQDYSNAYPGSIDVALAAEKPGNVGFYQYRGFDTVTPYEVKMSTYAAIFVQRRGHLHLPSTMR
jgi:hypothetical protein